MELDRDVVQSADISAELAILSYAYDGVVPLEIIARVDLGTADEPIAGGGEYVLQMYIDSVLITPTSLVPVPAGAVRTIMQSRAVALDPGDVVTIKVLGLPADTQVGATASLRTATPLQKSDIFGGGAVSVDHDYGGADNWAVQAADSGAAVDGADVQVYRAEDWSAGRTANSYVVARTTTDVGGRWRQALMLDPGDYVVRAFKQGEYNPTTEPLTVAAED